MNDGCCAKKEKKKKLKQQLASLSLFSEKNGLFFQEQLGKMLLEREIA